MKLENPQISILINSDYTEIKITDSKSNTDFVRVKLTPEQLSMALSRLGNIPCEADVYGLDKIGKTHENKTFEFKLPENFESFRRNYTDKQLKEMADNLLSDGWVSDEYFSSQNSFFTKEGKKYARAIIRRWV